jgi:hypothetical protein
MRKRRLIIGLTTFVLATAAAFAFLAAEAIFEGSVSSKGASPEKVVTHYGLKLVAGNGAYEPCTVGGGEGPACVLAKTNISNHEIFMENTSGRPVTIAAKTKLETKFSTTEEVGCPPSWFVAEPGKLSELEGSDAVITALLAGTEESFTIPTGVTELNKDAGGVNTEQVRTHERYEPTVDQSGCRGQTITLSLKIAGTQ